MFHQTRRNWLTRLAPPVAGLIALALVANLSAADTAGVSIQDQGKKLTVQVNGHLFTEYYYQDVPRPYCYPVIGPGGAAMTRNWPMKDVPGEEKDHPHHKSLWFTHGDVNGIDFWSDGANRGHIVHSKFNSLQSGEKNGVIKEFNQWMSPKGDIVCTEDRTIRFTPLSDGSSFIDFEITIHAANGDVKFGDTKEGSMAIRLAESMRLTGPKNRPGQGHIINSAGVKDGQTWGKRANWCDYYGPVDGKIVGVAIFDHPQNPRHPTWWHVRDYGLFAANPFGVHDFEKKPAGTGDFTIPAGKSETFRYRFYLHPGNDQEAKVAQMYQEYTQEKVSE